MALRPFCGLAAGWLLAGCATHVNPYYDASKAHHAPDGFRNNHIERVNKPLSDLVRWRIAAFRDGLPPPAKEPTPVTAPNLEQLKLRAASVTWIGHATTLVQCGGLNVLTDPVFGERASPVTFAGPQRAQPPGIALADLPPIDVIVISHNHYDHLDVASVRSLSDKSEGRTLILVPLGLKPFLEREGVRNVIEMDWWDQRMVKGVEFHLVPVQHWSARGLNDRNQTLWGGWAVFAPDLRWYFSGDTGYSLDFADTHSRLNAKVKDRVLFDVALLAIGAYEPRWFMTEQHMNPAEALQAHKDLGARRSIGIHWGTFSLTDEPLDAPPRDLAAARRAMGVSDEDFFVVKIGETRTIHP